MVTHAVGQIRGHSPNPRHPCSNTANYDSNGEKADNQQPTTDNQITKSTLLALPFPYPPQVLGIVKGILAGEIGVLAHRLLCGHTAAFVKIVPEECQHLGDGQALVKLAILPCYYPSEQKGQVAHLKAVERVGNLNGAEFYLVFAHGFSQGKQVIEVHQPTHNEPNGEITAFLTVQCTKGGCGAVHRYLNGGELPGVAHAVNRTVNAQQSFA
jgi:hypothetical protein